MTCPGLSSEAQPLAPVSSTVTPPASLSRLPRAHVVVTSAHGVVEVERDGSRYVGVLDAPGATVSVGSALALKILCRAENAYPYVVEDPRDLTVHVLAIDDAEIVGTRQLLHPGVGLDVAVSVHDGRSPLAPPLPVVVGSSLDDALANAALAETLEPDPQAHADEDDIEDVITGSLRRLPLAELVQALSFAKKTAAIHLRIEGVSGVIHLDNGEITCAQLDDDPQRAILRGAAAFHRLLAHDRGSFRVSFAREWHERNVHVSTQMLLLDGLRMIDEAHRDGRNAREETRSADGDSEANDAAADAVIADAGDEEGRDVEVEAEAEAEAEAEVEVEVVELDDAAANEEGIVALEELDVRPAMRAHIASPALPPVLSSVLAAPRPSTR